MTSEIERHGIQNAPEGAIFEHTDAKTNPTELWDKNCGLAFSFEEYLGEHAPRDFDTYVRASDSLTDTLIAFQHASIRINILDSVVNPENYGDTLDTTIDTDEFYSMHRDGLNGMILQSITNGKHVQTIFSEEHGNDHMKDSIKNIFDDTLESLESNPSAIGIIGERNGIQLIIDAMVNGRSISLKNLEKETVEDWQHRYSLSRESLHELHTIANTVPVTEYQGVYKKMVDAAEDDASRSIIVQSIAAYEMLAAVASTAHYLRYKSKERASFLSNLETIHGLLEKHTGFTIDEASDATATPTLEYGTLKPMEVDWTILPPGELGEAARTIVHQLEGRGQEGLVIDLERLRALDLVREKWGKDASYYVVGSLKNRPVGTENAVESPEDYIMLILQNLDNDGTVIGEHAVAESPVVGRNATYVFRHDVDDLSWRDIMSMRKKDARFFNARQVKHTKTQGVLTPEITAQKVDTLLSCDTELFVKGEFRSPNTVKIRKRLSATALSRTAEVA